MSLQHVGKGVSDASTSVGAGRATGADRRSFLKSMAGVAAASGLAAGRCAASAPAPPCCARTARRREREPLVQPMEIRSQGGVFETTLTAAPHRLQIGETELPGFFYNGTYLPPLWRVRLGDVMRVSVAQRPHRRVHQPAFPRHERVAARAERQRLHPLLPGHEFHYEVTIPRAGRQEPGLYWYHPHGHGFVTKQMLGGMSGAFVVEGAETQFPIVARLPERFFLIKHAEPGGGREIITVNGQLNPLVDIRPGEMQFWRIANIGATLFFPLQIAGMPLYVIATDGHPLAQPKKIDQVLLGPGQRIDAIVDRPAGRRIRDEHAAVQEHGVAGPVPRPADRDRRVRGRLRRRRCRAGDPAPARRRPALDRRGAHKPDRRGSGGSSIRAPRTEASS